MIVANCREGPALIGEIIGVYSHLVVNDLKIKQACTSRLSAAAQCVAQADTNRQVTESSISSHHHIDQSRFELIGHVLIIFVIVFKCVFELKLEITDFIRVYLKSKKIFNGEICFMIGIMFPIIPPGPIKNAPRAIKSDCEDLENPTFF